MSSQTPDVKALVDAFGVIRVEAEKIGNRQAGNALQTIQSEIGKVGNLPFWDNGATLMEQNNEILRQMVAMNATLGAGMNNLNTRMDHLTDRVDHLADRVDTLTTSINSLTSKVGTLEAKVDENKASIKNLAVKVDENSASISTLTTRVNTLVTALDENITNIHTLAAKVDQNKTWIITLSTKVDENKDNIITLTARVDDIGRINARLDNLHARSSEHNTHMNMHHLRAEEFLTSLSNHANMFRRLIADGREFRTHFNAFQRRTNAA